MNQRSISNQLALDFSILKLCAWPSCDRFPNGVAGYCVKHYHRVWAAKSNKAVEKQCEQCGASYRVGRHVAATSRYCSKQCTGRATIVLRQPPAKRIDRLCVQCGKPYQCSPYQVKTTKYCSRRCNGLASGNHERTNFTRPCWYCGKPFYAKLYEDVSHPAGQRRYCSRACRAHSMHIDLLCVQCGEPFTVPAHLGPKRRLCSRRCMGAYISATRRGGQHWNWHGGVTAPYYGSDWKSQRELCRARDGYSCRVCGIHRDTIGSEHMDVHHCEPWRVSHDNALGNLVMLCDPCHHAVEYGKVPCPANA
jgi:hypothetical protein